MTENDSSFWISYQNVKEFVLRIKAISLIVPKASLTINIKPGACCSLKTFDVV